MATINTSKLTGGALDVATIVSQLMEVERRPLAAISSKIERAEVKISSLGTFQSKLSALQDAVNLLQTPGNFKAYSLTSSNAAVATVEQATGTMPGLYKLDITQLASNAVVSLIGNSEAQYLSQYNFMVGSGSGSESLQVTVPAASAPGAQAHYEALRDAFNTAVGNSASLRDRFAATLLDFGNGNWGLSIQSVTTGLENNIELTGGVLGTTPVALSDIQAASRPAKDAKFAINDVEYTRSSNSLSLLGLQLDLRSEGSIGSPVTTNIEVRQTAVNKTEAIEGLASAYNDLLAQYKSLTESNVDARLRGVFNSDSTLASIMRQINTRLMGDFSTGTGSPLKGVGALGLEFADNGQLVYKPSLIADNAMLEAALSRGLSLGSSSTNNLSTQLADTLAFGGVLFERIEAEKTTQRDLSRRQATFEEKLQKIQERYTAQYAALDALLFRLNSTSTALKGALDALAANNNRD
jgi:flagellar hook-associated protein 2